MNLEEILQSVENEDIKEGIVSLINAEKQRGIDSYNKKDKEVLNLKSKIKDLGYDSEKYDNVDSFFEALKDKDTRVKDSEMTIAQLNEKLNDVTATLEKQRVLSEKKAKESKTNKLTAELTNKIGNKFYGSQYMIESLINNERVDLSEDGSVVGRKGDDIIPFEKFYETLEEENRSNIKVEQTKGTGSDKGTETEITQSDFVRRVKEQINK